VSEGNGQNRRHKNQLGYGRIEVTAFVFLIDWKSWNKTGEYDADNQLMVASEGNKGEVL
jgi:hypothetical protein